MSKKKNEENVYEVFSEIPEWPSQQRPLWFEQEEKDIHTVGHITGFGRQLRLFNFNESKDENGNPKYEGGRQPYSPQMVFSVKMGEVSFAVRGLQTSDPRIAVQVNWRATVLRPELYRNEWDRNETPDPEDYLDQMGCYLFELPRGRLDKGKTLGSEAGEETGYRVKDTMEVAQVNPDSALLMTSPIIVLNEMEEVHVEIDAHEKTQIVKVLWLTPKALRTIASRQGHLNCGLSCATLWIIRSFLLEGLERTDENRPWIELGQQM